MSIINYKQEWLKECSQAISADSRTLGWESLQAYACHFDPSINMLEVASDPNILTLEINTCSPTRVNFEFGENDSAEIAWNPGDIFIYPNFEYSRWRWDSSHSTSLFFLPYSRLKKIMMNCVGEPYGHPALIPGVSRSDHKLRKLLQLISAELVSESSNGEDYVGALVDATLIHLAKNYIAERDTISGDNCFLSSQQLAKIKKFVTDNVDTPISVADMAEVAGAKLFEFPKAFRSTVGITPYQYVIRERVNWAEHLLGTTDLSLAELSYIAGFSSQSHFTRTFRQQIGVTPQIYRQSLSFKTPPE
jgi:AraC family transcriptional regulator